MPIKMTTPDGFIYEFDDVEDAVKIQTVIQAREKSRAYTKRQKPEKDGNQEPAKDDVAIPEDIEQRIMNAFVNAEGGKITTGELSRKVKVVAARLPPLIRKVRKSLEAKFGPGVLTREAYHENGRPKSKYTISQKAIDELRSK
jgi:hypothetical protein